MLSSRAYARRALAGAVLCFAVAGCVEERTFYIIQNQIATAEDEGCVAGTADTSYRPQGTLDVSAGQGYWMFPLLRLDVESSTTTAPGPERNQFTLRNYRVTLDLGKIPGSYPTELTKFEHPTSGLLKPGTSLAGMVKVIPDALAQQLNLPENAQVMITAQLQAVATRLGTDSELESSTFRYPIELCSGCLVRVLDPCPTAAAPAQGEQAPSFETNACGLPQDTPVACCKESGVMKCLRSGGTGGGSSGGI